MQSQMQGQHVAVREELFPAGGGLVAILQGLGARCLAAPHGHSHAKSLAVAGHQLPDPAIAPDAEGAAAQRTAHGEVGRHGRCLEARLLPGTVLEVGDVLGQSAHGRHDQGPGQLGRGHR